ncbi:MAG: hypothetical protein N2689_15345 [Verrucomicrobiae bacterium]|nr:hypothetical protein [Verrucomicrobiae bacterium]
MREFHHVGLPTDEKHVGERWVPDTKVWTTNPDAHPYRVEFLRFEPDTPVKGPVRDQVHLAFKTDDLQREIEGENVLLGPFSPRAGLRVVFILKDGAVFEFMQWD